MEHSYARAAAPITWQNTARALLLFAASAAASALAGLALDAASRSALTSNALTRIVRHSATASALAHLISCAAHSNAASCARAPLPPARMTTRHAAASSLCAHQSESLTGDSCPRVASGAEMAPGAARALRLRTEYSRRLCSCIAPPN